MFFYLDPETMIVKDQVGNGYSIPMARKIYEMKKVKDYNMAFARLIKFGWDIKKLKAFYKNIG